MVASKQKDAVDDSARGVRDRLLDSAERLFAEHGFGGTSIRDLATAAGCNIASVNYYFGSKENLYIETWRRHLLAMTQTRVASIDKVLSASGGRPVLEDLLRSFAHAFIGPLVDKKGGPRLIKLMVREMLDPHLPASMFAEEVIKPTMSAMGNALARACPGLPESKIRMAVFSVIGQLVHTIRVKTMQDSMDDAGLAMLEPADMIEHIVAFSAAGIRAYAGGETEC